MIRVCVCVCIIINQSDSSYSVKAANITSVRTQVTFLPTCTKTHMNMFKRRFGPDTHTHTHTAIKHPHTLCKPKGFPGSLSNLFLSVSIIFWIIMITSGTQTHTQTYTHTHARTHTRWGLTSRESELNLFIDDLQGDEVVFLVEPTIVEKQSISFSGSKPVQKY